jgi:hypothetical protein
MIFEKKYEKLNIRNYILQDKKIYLSCHFQTPSSKNIKEPWFGRIQPPI